MKPAERGSSCCSAIADCPAVTDSALLPVVASSGLVSPSSSRPRAGPLPDIFGVGGCGSGVGLAVGGGDAVTPAGTACAPQDVQLTAVLAALSAALMEAAL